MEPRLTHWRFYFFFFFFLSFLSFLSLDFLLDFFPIDVPFRGLRRVVERSK